MLHPTRRINAVNRSNLVAVRQIESVVLSLLADAPLIGHIDRMTKSDPTLALIAAQFTRHAVQKSGSGYTIVDRRTENPVARLRPIPQRSLRAPLLVKYQGSLDNLRKPRSHETHARQCS
jgi:hypothetical protein